MMYVCPMGMLYPPILTPWLIAVDEVSSIPYDQCDYMWTINDVINRKQVILVSIFRSTPNRIPLRYRCSIIIVLE